MNSYLQKRLETLSNPRARKHHKKPDFSRSFVRPSSHLESVIDDMRHSPPPAVWMDAPGLRGPARETMQTISVAGNVVGKIAAAVTMDAIDSVKAKIEEAKKEKARIRRRKYYATDAAYRKKISEAIQQAKQKPLNPCPSPLALEDAYLHRRDSDWAKIHFGRLVIDLEENAAISYAITGNKFQHTSGGVLNWLKENSPLLAKHYFTCQRYKRMAQDFQSDLDSGRIVAEPKIGD